MTKKEAFEAILAKVAEDEVLVEFVEKEIALLEKRAAKPRKKTKTQLENEAFKEVILELIEGAETGLTATEVATALGITPQRAVPILKKLTDEERVLRVEGKGKEKTRFTLA